MQPSLPLYQKEEKTEEGDRIVTALFSLTWPRGQGKLVRPPLPLYQKEEKTGKKAWQEKTKSPEKVVSGWRLSPWSLRG